jgi:hypothetical protein
LRSRFAGATSVEAQASHGVTYGTFREPGLEALGHDCGAEGSKGSEGGETHNDSGVECGR